MPVWFIEAFGARELDQAFLWIVVMTSPVWLAMIFFPRSRFVARWAHPYVVAPVYCVVLLYLLWQSFLGSVLPGMPGRATYSDAQEFARHPIAFLALFCNLQILNVTVGTVIYQKANRCGINASFELLVCWFVGALALIPFSIRLILRGKLRS